MYFVDIKEKNREFSCLIQLSQRFHDLFFVQAHFPSHSIRYSWWHENIKKCIRAKKRRDKKNSNLIIFIQRQVPETSQNCKNFRWEKNKMNEAIFARLLSFSLSTLCFQTSNSHILHSSLLFTLFFPVPLIMKKEEISSIFSTFPFSCVFNQSFHTFLSSLSFLSNHCSPSVLRIVKHVVKEKDGGLMSERKRGKSQEWARKKMLGERDTEGRNEWKGRIWKWKDEKMMRGGKKKRRESKKWWWSK